MKRLIQTFRFLKQDRSEFDLSGGLRISDSNRLEVPRSNTPSGPTPDDPEYDLSQTLTARTPTFNPLEVVGWELFSVRHPGPPANPNPALTTAPYEIRFRVSDGSTDLYWDGAAWSAATLGTHWNTEAEVSANLPTFDTSSRSIAFVVNMWTTDERVTPRLHSLKLLYQSRILEKRDLIYESLIPEFREQLRGRSRVGYEMPAAGTTLDLSDLEALGFEGGYDITDVIEAYNYSQDPNRDTDILASWDLGTSTVTLTEEIPLGEVLWLEFEFRPTVAAHTSSDYSEISSIPGVDILDVSTRDFQEVPQPDAVIDRATNSGWSVPGPSVRHVSFTVEIICNKQYDLEYLTESLRIWARKRCLRMRGMDYELYCATKGDAQYFPVHGAKNTRKSVLKFEVMHVPFFELPAVETYGIQGIEFSGGNLQLSL